MAEQGKPGSTTEYHRAGFPSKPADTAAAEPQKAEKQDVADRKTAAPMPDPLDNSNNDQRVKDIRAAQDAEMKEYQKNYKKAVDKKA